MKEQLEAPCESVGRTSLKYVLNCLNEDDKMAEEEPEGKAKKIIELIASVQRAGNERGKRIYFDNKSIEEIKEKCGDDFFLFTERTLLAFVYPAEEKITLTSLKGVYKKYL